jgi:hypothetical protein
MSVPSITDIPPPPFCFVFGHRAPRSPQSIHQTHALWRYIRGRFTKRPPQFDRTWVYPLKQFKSALDDPKRKLEIRANLVVLCKRGCSTVLVQAEQLVRHDQIMLVAMEQCEGNLPSYRAGEHHSYNIVNG